MPRLDTFALSSDKFEMPDVEVMFNRNALNAHLDRIMGANPKPPQTWPETGLWLQLVRLTDKALREYEAARAELLDFVDNEDRRPKIGQYIRAIDHLENCVSAAHRGVLLADSLRNSGYGLKAPTLTINQETRLRELRNSIEHTDERLMGNPSRPRAPRFDPGQPFALRLANKSIAIGNNVLTYRALHSAIRKLYQTVECIRGPSVRPNDVWKNATTRTDSGAVASTAWKESDYGREISRAAVNH